MVADGRRYTGIAVIENPNMMVVISGGTNALVILTNKIKYTLGLVLRKKK